MPRRNSLALAALLLATAACGPLVQIGGNAKPPAALLTLRADLPPAPASAKPGDTLAIALPTVPGSLQTLRLPVTTANTEVQYLKDGSWIEQPAKLFQRLLLDVVSAKAGVVALDGRSFDVAPERKLSGQLLEFGLDVRSSPVVRVRYDATLTSNAGKLLGVRSFRSSAPLPAETPEAAAIALNQAANAVASDVAAWIASN